MRGTVRVTLRKGVQRGAEDVSGRANPLGAEAEAAVGLREDSVERIRLVSGSGGTGSRRLVTRFPR